MSTFLNIENKTNKIWRDVLSIVTMLTLCKRDPRMRSEALAFTFYAF